MPKKRTARAANDAGEPTLEELLDMPAGDALELMLGGDDCPSGAQQSQAWTRQVKRVAKATAKKKRRPAKR